MFQHLVPARNTLISPLVMSSGTNSCRVPRYQCSRNLTSACREVEMVRGVCVCVCVCVCVLQGKRNVIEVIT